MSSLHQRPTFKHTLGFWMWRIWHMTSGDYNLTHWSLSTTSPTFSIAFSCCYFGEGEWRLDLGIQSSLITSIAFFLPGSPMAPQYPLGFHCLYVSTSPHTPEAHLPPTLLPFHAHTSCTIPVDCMSVSITWLHRGLETQSSDYRKTMHAESNATWLFCQN